MAKVDPSAKVINAYVALTETLLQRLEDVEGDSLDFEQLKADAIANLKDVTTEGLSYEDEKLFTDHSIKLVTFLVDGWKNKD